MNNRERKLTDDQRKHIFSLIWQLKMSKDEIETAITGSIGDLSVADASALITAMETAIRTEGAGSKSLPTAMEEISKRRQQHAVSAAKEETKAPEASVVVQDTAPMAHSPSGMGQIMSLDDSLRLFDLFEEAKQRLLKPTDFQAIMSYGKMKGRFIKKSGWKKIQTFFGVATDIVSVHVLSEDDGDPYALVMVRATWGGRSAVETGTYTRKEMISKKQPYNLSNLIATATTRASNRAISAIVGGGEVSAEEITEAEA